MKKSNKKYQPIQRKILPKIYNAKNSKFASNDGSFFRKVRDNCSLLQQSPMKQYEKQYEQQSYKCKLMKRFQASQRISQLAKHKSTLTTMQTTINTLDTQAPTGKTMSTSFSKSRKQRRLSVCPSKVSPSLEITSVDINILLNLNQEALDKWQAQQTHKQQNIIKKTQQQSEADDILSVMGMSNKKHNQTGQYRHQKSRKVCKGAQQYRIQDYLLGRIGAHKQHEDQYDQYEGQIMQKIKVYHPRRIKTNFKDIWKL